jgi:hypothetical protein
MVAVFFNELLILFSGLLVVAVEAARRGVPSGSGRVKQCGCGCGKVTVSA